MKIFLTGASSYIGKYIILNYLTNGHKVLSTSRTNPKINEKKHKWIKHDLSKKPLNLNRFRPDIVIHLAGSAWMGRSPESYINSNILTTDNLVKSLKGKKIKKIFYLSTRDVYGDVAERILVESSPLNNPSIYGYSKLIAEKILLDSFPTIILRLPSIIGLGTHGWLNSVSKFNNFMHASELSKIISRLSIAKVKSDIFLVSCSNIVKSIDVVKLLKIKINSNSKIKINKNQKSNYIISSKKLNKFYKTMKVEEVVRIYSEELKLKKMYTC